MPRHRAVRKRYRAVVAGRLEGSSQQGGWPADAGPGPQRPGVDHTVDCPLEGRNAITEVSVTSHSRCLRYGGWVTTVDLRPHTGRRHQLRRHLALCLGHPILGDSLYSRWAGAPAVAAAALLAASPDELRTLSISAGGRSARAAQEADENTASSSSSSSSSGDGGDGGDSACSCSSSNGVGRDGGSDACGSDAAALQAAAAAVAAGACGVEQLRGWGLALWAVGLEFRHPASGEWLSFSLPEPPRFAKLRAQQAARWNKFHGSAASSSTGCEEVL
jgi:hypothetical protein